MRPHHPIGPAAALRRALFAAFGGVLLAGVAGFAAAQQAAEVPTQPSPPPVGQGQAAPPGEETQKLQKIEVTGSNIKRIEGETALPVQVITAEDIEREGVTTAAELLARVSSNDSALSYPVANAFSDSGRQGFTGASLRGLGSNKTLILINGRRVSDYAFDATGESGGVDLSSIPLQAVKRVEILKDGASAIYGSDAIGGVINFIMRDDYRGAQVSASYADTQHGGGGYKRATATAGFGDLAADKYNAFVNFSYQADQSLFGSDRDFARTSYIPNQGIDFTSGNSSPANVFLPGIGAASPNYPQCAPPLSYTTIDTPNECRYDPNPVLGLLPQDEHTQVYGRGTLQLTPDHQLFLEASYSESRYIFTEQPVPISSASTFNQAPVNIYPTSPYYPFSLVAEAGLTPQPLQVFWRANELGERVNTTTADDTRIVFGSKGRIGDWDYDTAYNFNESRAVDLLDGGYASQAYELPILNSGIVNFFGPNTPQVTALLQGGLLGDYQDRSATAKTSAWDGHVSKEVFNLPAGPVSLAFGAELRKETLDQNSAPELLSGDILGFGTASPSESASREIYSAFAELDFPIIKKLEGNIAVRSDHYTDFGTTTNPKVSLRWEPAKWVLFRGAYGTGFHAPDLSELFSPQVQTNTPIGLSDPLRCPYTGSIFDCNTQFTAIQGGNPSLKPERSEEVTFGIVLEPIEDLSLAVDFFKINVSDQIGALPAAFILSNPQYYQYVTRGPSDPTVPTGAGPITGIVQTEINIGDTHISGADVDMRYRYRNAALGTFYFSLTGTTYHQYDIENLDGSYFSQVGQSAAEGAIPRWQHFASVTWERGPWDWTVGQLYQMGYYDANLGPDGNPRRVGSYEIYDTTLIYSGIKNWKFTAGVHNIFDRAPPFTNQDFVFQTGYDPSYGDPRLRTFVISAEYVFKK